MVDAAAQRRDNGKYECQIGGQKWRTEMADRNGGQKWRAERKGPTSTDYLIDTK